MVRLWVAGLFAVVVAVPIVEAEQLQLLSGQQVEAEVTGIDEEGKVASGSLDRPLTVDDIRSISRKSGDRPGIASGSVLMLAGGGRLPIATMTLVDEECEVTTPSGRAFSLAIDDLHAVQFDKKDGSLFQRALESPSAKLDRFFVSRDDRVRQVDGLLYELTDSEVTFAWKGREQTLPRTSLSGIVFASVGGDEDWDARAFAEDGSVLLGSISSLREGVLDFELSSGSKLKLPWNSIHSIEIRSRNLTFLSDLDPTESEQKPIVTLPRPWRRDANVSGKPLKLNDPEAGKELTYSKGLGMHSYCRLAFDIGGDYDKFAATIGIDASTNGKGSCVFQVLGDGRKLFELPITGAAPPHPIELDVAEVRKLTLVVQHGADLDLADHANWCDARVLRVKDKSQ